MSMTTQDREWMDKRDTLTSAEMAVLDDVFYHVYKSAAQGDVNAAGDDRAASLEAALTRFLIESRRG